MGGGRAAPALALALAVVVALVVVTPGGAAAAQGRTLTLDQALRAAEEGNPTYRRACLAVEQAELALARLEADQTVRANALALEQARGAAATARVARDTARRRLRLDVRRAYFTLLTAHRQQEVAREALDQAREQRRVIEGRRGPGAATVLETLSAEKVLAEAAVGVERADTGARLAELTLLDLVGWPSGTALALQENAPDGYPPVPEEATAIRLALDRSPEVRQAREGREAARLALNLADNDYTPDLVRKAAAVRLEDASLAAEEAERRLALQVQRAMAEARLAEVAAEAAAKAVSAAAEGYRAAKVRFDVGQVVGDDLLAAQVRLFQARQAELQARLDRDLARAALFSLIGE